MKHPRNISQGGGIVSGKLSYFSTLNFIEIMYNFSRMKKIIIISMLALAGCSARPILANPEGITFERVSHGNKAKTAAAAQRHCEQYGKNAVQSDSGYGSLTFRCK